MKKSGKHLEPENKNSGREQARASLVLSVIIDPTRPHYPKRCHKSRDNSLILAHLQL